MDASPKRIYRAVVRRIANRLIRRVCDWEAEDHHFRRNERPAEFSFLFRNLLELSPETVLDVGTGDSALPHLIKYCGFLVTASDNVRDYWPSGMSNRHWPVVHDDILASELPAASFDLINCISVLEHIVEPDRAIASMHRLLRPGGHLVLTCPYSESRYEANVYELEDSSYGRGSPYVCQSYSRAELDRWLAADSWSIVEQEFWRFWTGEVWTCGERVTPAEKVGAGDPHQLTCLLLRRD